MAGFSFGCITMEDVNAEIMQSGLHRLWARRQRTSLGPMHEIEILDQDLCASTFDDQVS